MTAAEIETLVAAAGAASIAACLADATCRDVIADGLAANVAAMSDAAKLALLFACNAQRAIYKASEYLANKAGCNCEPKAAQDCTLAYARCGQALSCAGMLESIVAERGIALLMGCDAAYEWEKSGTGDFEGHFRQIEEQQNRVNKCLTSIAKNCHAAVFGTIAPFIPRAVSRGRVIIRRPIPLPRGPYVLPPWPRINYPPP